MESPAFYRYNTAREYAADLKERYQHYRGKIEKYNRRITTIDVTVYSISGVMAGAGIILSSVIMICPIAVPIAISAVTTLGGIATAITKKISSCSQRKLHNVVICYSIAYDAYLKLSELISASLDNNITDSEFSAISSCYHSALIKLERYNNNNNVAKHRGVSITSTDRREHHSGTNKHDIDNINEARI